MNDLIQITVGNVLIGTISVSFLLGVAVWLAKNWISARIDKSIQHAYDKQLEDYKLSRLQRQKAELIAKLFSKWIKYQGREEIILNKAELIDYYHELNQVSLEFSLWMEDIGILNDVMARLQNKKEARTVYDVMGDVRKLLLENPNDQFNPNNIVLWPTGDKIDEIYGKLHE
ncbi:MAG: hypothetical protein WAW90_00885 [Minisyncoccia bacterium]